MTTIAAVLSVIQEKVNNPSADDPFEPEIAAVSGQKLRWGGPDRESDCMQWQQLKNDKGVFMSTAREWTKK
jgi:hypothetical protein